MHSLPQAVGARPGQIQRVIGSQRVIPSPPRRSVEMERDGVELVRGVSPLVEALAEAASRTVSAGYHPLEPQREASGLDSPRLEAQREALASMEGDSQVTLHPNPNPNSNPSPNLTRTLTLTLTRREISPVPSISMREMAPSSAAAEGVVTSHPWSRCSCASARSRVAGYHPLPSPRSRAPLLTA